MSMEDLDRFAECCGPKGQIPVTVLYLHNSLVDVRTYEIGWDDVHGVAELLHVLMPNFTEMTLPTKYLDCPAVRVYLEAWHKDSPTNFRLQSFFHTMGIKGVSPRCRGALVVGLCDQHQSDVFINIPAEVYLTGPPLIPVGINGRIDICCDQPVAGTPCNRLGWLCDDIRGVLEFPLERRCKLCTVRKRRCGGRLGCSHCGEDEVCEPQEDEWIERAKDVGVRVKANRIAHHDLAKYLLHFQAASYNGCLLYGKDTSDVSRRVHAGELLPMISPLGPFPLDVMAFLNTSPFHKLEWMNEGQYVAELSEGYQKYILPETVMYSIARKTKLPPKLVDTCNLAFATRAYETWVASIDYPGVIAEFTGAGYWRDGKVMWTKVRMMSLRFGLCGVLTATVIHRKED